MKNIVNVAVMAMSLVTVARTSDGGNQRYDLGRYNQIAAVPDRAPLTIHSLTTGDGDKDGDGDNGRFTS